jgi:hypothetical protein
MDGINRTKLQTLPLTVHMDQTLLLKRSISTITRNIIKPNKINYNISSNEDNLGQNNNQLGHIYFSSNTVMPQQHIPSSALGTKFTNISYDRYTSKGMNSSLMTAKEELAPNFIFTPYWDSILSNTSVSNRLNTLLNYDELQGSLSLPNIIEYNEYDFKN